MYAHINVYIFTCMERWGQSSTDHMSRLYQLPPCLLFVKFHKGICRATKTRNEKMTDSMKRQTDNWTAFWATNIQMQLYVDGDFKSIQHMCILVCESWILDPRFQADRTDWEWSQAHVRGCWKLVFSNHDRQSRHRSAPRVQTISAVKLLRQLPSFPTPKECDFPNAQPSTAQKRPALFHLLGGAAICFHTKVPEPPAFVSSYGHTYGGSIRPCLSQRIPFLVRTGHGSDTMTLSLSQKDVETGARCHKILSIMKTYPD